MLINYFNISGNLFYYLESNIFILYTYLGVVKLKKKDFYSLLLNGKILFSYNVIRKIHLVIKDIFFLAKYGYINKFKIVGVGYKKLYNNNIVVYKLRYSHLIYNVLPLNILSFKKHKRRKYISIFSLNKNKINSILNTWLSYRVPNIYTKKGFFRRDKNISFKKIVKKLL